MNKNQHIPPGFKPSPVGPIPGDWEVKKICECGKVFTGNTPPTKDINNYGTEYLFVSPIDLGETKYITKTEKKLSKKGFNISRRFPIGSVLFTCIGSTIGKSGIASEDLTSNQQINAIISNENHSNEFIYYQLNLNAKKIKLLAGEQAVPIIKKSQFELYKILIPPLPEQTAIANLLSTWDKAIETTQKLIAQKEFRKKWFMQVLLTGKKRVKQFGGEWKSIQLKEIGFFSKGVGITKEVLIDNGISCICYGEIYTTYNIVIDKVRSFIPAEIIKHLRRVGFGDILFTGSGETPEEIGKCVVYLKEDELYAGGDIIIFTPDKKHNPLYLSYLLNSDKVIKQKSSFAKGHSVVHIYSTDLEKITILLPFPEELPYGHDMSCPYID